MDHDDGIGVERMDRLGIKIELELEMQWEACGMKKRSLR